MLNYCEIMQKLLRKNNKTIPSMVLQGTPYVKAAIVEN